MAREGSASRNLEALAPLLCGPARGRCLLVSDDLEPGDVLLTGTPLGGGLLGVGDCIEAHSELLGRLTNTVVAQGD